MATATSSGRRGRRALAALAAAAVLAGTAIALTVGAVSSPGASPGRSPEGGFPALSPAAAPAGWRHVALPNQTAVLSFPPTLHTIAGDKVAVSAARLSTRGMFELDLNATPREGSENLRNWATFRLRLLRADDAVSARRLAAAHAVRFRGGSGSCVLDTYLTRTGHHRYQEIACLVQGRTSASVIVGAAPVARWAWARLLLRAVAAYQVR